jgi:hypothetical protein
LDDLERYIFNLHRWAISQGHLSHLVEMPVTINQSINHLLTLHMSACTSRIVGAGVT